MIACFPEMLAAAIITRHWAMNPVIVQAISTSETSVDFYQIARRHVLEDSHLHS
jgi:hypothetical protein